jgi:probable blue pigment (indigoidine) exporter
VLSSVAQTRREQIALGLLVSAVVVWGCTPRVTAEASPFTEPLTLTTLRAAPAALLLLLALPVLRYHMPKGRAVWTGTIISGLLMVTVFLACFTEGIVRAGPGNAIVLGSTAPFFIAGAAWLGFGDRPTRRAMFGMVVGFVGVVLIVSTQIDGDASGRDMAIGLGCSLAAAVGWAAGTLVVKQLLTDHPDTDLVGLTTGQYVVGSAVLLVISLAAEGTGGTEWGEFDLWWPVIFVSIVGSALATVAYLGALRWISATRASPFLFLSPVVAVLLELVLGHVPEAVVLAGMVLTIVGVGIVTIAPRSARVAADLV